MAADRAHSEACNAAEEKSRVARRRQVANPEEAKAAGGINYLQNWGPNKDVEIPRQWGYLMENPQRGEIELAGMSLLGKQTGRMSVKRGISSEAGISNRGTRH